MIDPNLCCDFRSKKRSIVTFYEWVGLAKVPALHSVLKLYKHLIDKKVKIVFLTGSSDAYTKAGEDNLKSAGYTSYLGQSDTKVSPNIYFDISVHRLMYR